MAARGGKQRIPRPALFVAGQPSPWSALGASERIFTLADVRLLCERLPAPKEPAWTAPGSRASAVLIPIFERDGEAHIILTKRPDTMEHHRGEIVFPGGKFHSELDDTLRDAALREAQEEIDLDPAAVEVGGELDTIATASSRFTITPVVGLLASIPEVRPHPREVARVFDVAISELMDSEVYREELWKMDSREWPMPFFELVGETVWGATARILMAFLAALSAHRLA